MQPAAGLLVLGVSDAGVKGHFPAHDSPRRPSEQRSLESAPSSAGGLTTPAMVGSPFARVRRMAKSYLHDGNVAWQSSFRPLNRPSPLTCDAAPVGAPAACCESPRGRWVQLSNDQPPGRAFQRAKLRASLRPLEKNGRQPQASAGTVCPARTTPATSDRTLVHTFCCREI
jgi:hypothetical protein